jgi:GNAT superfamily N-acetyltransferase
MEVIVPPGQYRVSAQWLTIIRPRRLTCAVPFGIGLANARNQQGLYLRVGLDGDSVSHLWVGDGRQGSWRSVLPVFRRTIHVPAVRTRFERAPVLNRLGGLTLELELARSDRDRAAARALVSRVHYLSPRLGGTVLVARFAERHHAETVRSAWWRGVPRNQRPAASAAEASGGLAGIVGCVVIERLMHGHPIGRNWIYGTEAKPVPGPEQQNEPGFRARAINELAVAWISRVAIDWPFQRMGIGAILCDVAREVAATSLIRPARWVELLRRVNGERMAELLGDGPGDFLTGFNRDLQRHLAYRLDPEPRASSRGMYYDHSTG